jgi:hypothetical protein
MYTLVCVGFVASCFLLVELQRKIAVYKEIPLLYPLLSVLHQQ